MRSASGSSLGPALGDTSVRRFLRVSIEEIYRQKKPEKLANGMEQVKQLVERCSEGSEVAFVRKLCEKFDMPEADLAAALDDDARIWLPPPVTPRTAHRPPRRGTPPRPSRRGPVRDRCPSLRDVASGR